MAKKQVRKKKPFAVVLDWDDTIGKFLGDLCFFHNKIHGSCIHPNDIAEWDMESVDVEDARGNRVLGAELFETFKKYEKYLYAQMTLKDGSKHAINIMKKLGYKIIVITARPEEFRLATEVNIIHHDMHVDELYFTKDKVKKIRELAKKYKIEVFADDKPSTVEDVNSKCKVNNVYLVDMAHNRELEFDEDIKRINSLVEIVRDLKDRS